MTKRQAPVQSTKPTTTTTYIDAVNDIRVLNNHDQFTLQHMPPGWVLNGATRQDVLASLNGLPTVQTVQRDGIPGTHVQSGQKNFILAKQLGVHMLAMPYISWSWHLSEHAGNHHPVKLIIGFYGGKAGTPKRSVDSFRWTHNQLPSYDRLLTIGYDQTALARGNMYDMGSTKYFVQRGGIEQTNLWHTEYLDLSRLYSHSWPTDNMADSFITFIGFLSHARPTGGGITFGSIRISR